MKNKYYVWMGILLLAFLTVLGFTISLVGGKMDNGICRFYFTSVMEVKDGELVIDGEKGLVSNSFPFQVGKDIKDADLHLVWQNDDKEYPGFLTAFELKDSTGKVITYVTGDYVDSQISLDEVKAGEYTAEFRYFVQEKEFRELLIDLGENISTEETVSYEGYENFGKDGKWSFDYAFELESHQNTFLVGRILINVSGVLLGLFLVLLMFMIIKKDANRRFEYDERQGIYRGRGFMYGFFTMMGYYFITAMFVMSDIPLPVETEVILLGGVFIGLVPFVCYCIWHDAYVSLYEKKNGLVVIFCFIILANLLVGIMNLISGLVVVDGKLTGACLPFMVIGLMVIFLITMFGKSFSDRKDEDE